MVKIKDVLNGNWFYEPEHVDEETRVAAEEQIQAMGARPDLKERSTHLPSPEAPRGAVVVKERPTRALKSAPVPDSPVDVLRDETLKEYAELADYIGIMPPDLVIESFKTFLRESGITVFALADVVAYMDAKARKESKEQAGWEWRALRAKDNDRRNLSFGTAATRQRDQFGGNGTVIKAASDYYHGPYASGQLDSRGQTWDMEPSSHPYDRTIPIHAVRKIAKIEKGFKGDVAFFVCDYALAPAIQYPDPFLMVVVPNLKANLGVGRFIIDFWDEPGFGIEHMLKTDL